METIRPLSSLAQALQDAMAKASQYQTHQEEEPMMENNQNSVAEQYSNQTAEPKSAPVEQKPAPINQSLFEGLPVTMGAAVIVTVVGKSFPDLPNVVVDNAGGFININNTLKKGDGATQKTAAGLFRKPLANVFSFIKDVNSKNLSVVGDVEQAFSKFCESIKNNVETLLNRQFNFSTHRLMASSPKALVTFEASTHSAEVSAPTVQMPKDADFFKVNVVPVVKTPDGENGLTTPQLIAEVAVTLNVPLLETTNQLSSAILAMQNVVNLYSKQSSVPAMFAVGINLKDVIESQRHRDALTVLSSSLALKVLYDTDTKISSPLFGQDYSCKVPSSLFFSFTDTVICVAG